MHLQYTTQPIPQNFNESFEIVPAPRVIDDTTLPIFEFLILLPITSGEWRATFTCMHNSQDKFRSTKKSKALSKLGFVYFPISCS